MNDILNATVGYMHPVVSSSVTANYTITTNDYFVKIGGLVADITINLPASPTINDQYIIKDVDGYLGEFTATIDGYGNDIDGEVEFILAHNYASITLVFTGIQWSICQSYAGKQNGNGYGIFADLPIQGQAGRTYYATDTGTTLYDDGAVWRPFGHSGALTPVSTTNFTWQNQSGATATNFGNGIFLTAPNNSGSQSMRFFYQTVPATPYTLTAKIIQAGGLVNGNAQIYGLAWGDGTKLVSLHVNNGDTAYDLNVGYWTDVFTPNSGVYVNNDFALMTQLEWLRISDDGTNFKAFVSRDGVNFINIWTASHTAFLTATRIGLILNPFLGNQYTSCMSWEIT